MSKSHKKSPSFGQSVFFESIEKSDFRPRLARAALNLGGRETDYPIDLAEVVRWLPWSDCQSVLAMASLSASAAFRWLPSQEQVLMEWASQPGE
jgi:hypothetical protein